MKALPEINQTWWVKLPTGIALTKAVVTDLTAHTVELKHYNPHTNWLETNHVRYLTEDLEFVERVQ